MSLIEKPVVQEKTAQSEWNDIKKRNYGMLKFIIRDHTNSFNQVWNNSKFTPQQMLVAMGTDCKALFEQSAALQTIIKTADPDYEILLPKFEVKFNEDGSYKENA